MMVINPQTKDDKLAYILNDSEASFLLSDSKLARVFGPAAAQAPSLRAVICAGPIPEGVGILAWDKALNATPIYHPPGVIPVDLAALIYTSGSTGNPKGVMMTHQNMVFIQGSLVEYLRLSPDERILNVLPLAFDYGLYQLLMAVHLGATLVLEPHFSFPAAVLKRVEEEQVTVFPGVPTVYATLLSLHKSSPLRFKSVRRVTNTAAHLPDDFVPSLREIFPSALIYKMYGLTECKRVCYLEPELIDAKPGSVGKAMPGTEVFLLSEAGSPVPPGEVGILHVRGPHVMPGYWRQPELSADMLKPGRYPGERVLCTHDHFRMDDEGFLYFVGRTDDIIKTRGEKVSPIEVENALHSLPGIREAAVVGVPDELLGEAVAAYVVLLPGATLSEADVKRLCLNKLENFMAPKHVYFLNELPKTGSGKVRKKSLRELVAT
jgi:acyl-CoA synthetase (AMP-forming)/AMP-acid ligase II